MAAGAVTSSLQPPVGVLRYYTDAVNGSDLNDGTSWTTAWKTLANAHRRISQVCCLLPTEVTDILLYARGTFNESLSATWPTTNRAKIHVASPVSDWTVQQAGTVVSTGGEVPAPAHGFLRIELGGGIVPTAADLGRPIQFASGGNITTSTILRVSGQYVWTLFTSTTLPAWVIAGAAATIYSLSLQIRDSVFISSQSRYGTEYDAAGVSIGAKTGTFIGISAKTWFLFYGNATVGCCEARDTGTAFTGRNSQLYYAFGSTTESSGSVPYWLSVELGLRAGPTINRFYTGLSCAGNARLDGGGYASFGAYVAGDLSSYGGQIILANGSFGSVTCETCSDFILSSVIARGQINARHGGFFEANGVSHLDLPATGLSNGLYYFRDIDARIGLSAEVEGNNTGSAGSGLYGIFATHGARLTINKSLNGLKGKDGFLRLDNCIVQTAAAMTRAAEEGRGPDLYVRSAKLYLGASFTKSATNPSGGGTKNLVLDVSGVSEIEQISGKFTLPAGSGANATDYDATYGAIRIRDSSRVRLGTFTGCGAGTTGVGCTIEKGGHLIHAGAGLSGVAPLMLGEEGIARAWPATVLTDKKLTYTDLQQPGTAMSIGPGAGIRPPVLDKFRDSGGGSDGVYTWRFPQVASAPVGTKELFFSFQIPHDYARGQDCFLHVHWSPGADGVAQNAKNVNWKAEYTVVKTDGTFGLTSDTGNTMQDACDGTDYKHQTSPEATISGAALEESSVMLVRVYRDSATANEFASDNAWLVSVDLHYPQNKPGTINRNPAFETVTSDRALCMIAPNVAL